ncbi:MAG: hypothetical protein AAF570_07930, partial [Bacteroidota bacterium]
LARLKKDFLFHAVKGRGQVIIFVRAHHFNVTIGQETYEMVGADEDYYLTATFDSVKQEIFFQARQHDDETVFEISIGRFPTFANVIPGAYRANTGCGALVHMSSKNPRIEGSWSLPEAQSAPAEVYVDIATVEADGMGGVIVTGAMNDAIMTNATDTVDVAGISFRIGMDQISRGSLFKPGRVTAEVDGTPVSFQSAHTVDHGGNTIQSIHFNAIRAVANHGFTFSIPDVERPATLDSLNTTDHNLTITFRDDLGCSTKYYAANPTNGNASLQIVSATEVDAQIALEGTFSGTFVDTGNLSDTIQVTEGTFLLYY